MKSQRKQREPERVCAGSPPAEESWWRVAHEVTGQHVFSKARTAYFAVAEARYDNGNSTGWLLYECTLSLVEKPEGLPLD